MAAKEQMGAADPIIGKVTEISEGAVYAIDKSGNARQLDVGSEIQANEEIHASDNSALKIELNDGNVLSIPEDLYGQFLDGAIQESYQTAANDAQTNPNQVTANTNSNESLEDNSAATINSPENLTAEPSSVVNTGANFPDSQLVANDQEDSRAANLENLATPSNEPGSDFNTGAREQQTPQTRADNLEDGSTATTRSLNTPSTEPGSEIGSGLIDNQTPQTVAGELEDNRSADPRSLEVPTTGPASEVGTQPVASEVSPVVSEERQNNENNAAFAGEPNYLREEPDPIFNTTFIPVEFLNEVDQIVFTLNENFDLLPVARDDLICILEGEGNSLTGNVIDGGTPGNVADFEGNAPAVIESIMHDGTTYVLGVDDVNGILTIESTSLGGKLVIRMVDGDGETAGEYTYFAPDSVMHRTETECLDKVEESFKYTIRDTDGDFSTANLTVQIADGGPDAGEGAENGGVLDMVHENGINPNGSQAGSDSNKTAGVINGFSLGPDDEGVILRLTLKGIADKNESDPDGVGQISIDDLQSEMQEITITATDGDEQTPASIQGVREDGMVVFELTLDASGTYTYEQFKPLDHPEAGEIGIDDILDLQFTYTIIDGDVCYDHPLESESDSQSEIKISNDVANGWITITVKDDGPQKVVTNAGMIHEKDLNWGLHGILESNFGADVPGTFSNLAFKHAIDPETGEKLPLTAGNKDVVFNETTDQYGNILLIGSIWKNEQDIPIVKVKVDPESGEYWVKLLHAIDHPDMMETGRFDQLKLVFNYTTTDKDGDSVENQLNVKIKDDGPESKKTQIMLDEDDMREAHGHLNADFGADGPDKAFAYGGLMYLSTFDPDGPQNNESNHFAELTSCDKPVEFQPTYMIGKFEILEGKIFHEGNGSEPGHWETVIKIGVNTKTGEYWVKLLQPIDHPDVNETGVEDQLVLAFKYITFDQDGDKALNLLKIKIKDDGPESKMTKVILDEHDITDQTHGQLNHHFGFDGPDPDVAYGGLKYIKAIDPDQYNEKVDLTSCNKPVVFHDAYMQGEFQIIEGKIYHEATESDEAYWETVLSLKINKETGEYWVKLLQPIDHPDLNETGSDDQLVLIFKYLTFDKDGDSTVNKLKIAIKDDGPEMKTVVAPMIDEQDVVDGVDVKLHTDYGADGPGTLSGLMLHRVIDLDTYEELALTSCGVDVIFDAAYMNAQGMMVLVGRADGEKVIQVKLDPAQDKAWIKLFKAIDHPDGHQTGEDDHLLLEFNYTVTDKDGDQVTNKLKITIKDDGPEAQVKTAPMIHEKDLVDSVDVKLHTDYGADGKGTLSGLMLNKVTDFDSHEELALTSCGEPVVFDPAYPNAEGMLVLIGRANGEKVIQVKLDPEQDKAWIKLFKPIDHPDNYQTGDQDQLLLEFKYTVTDKDGDHVTNKLKIAIKDDGPEMKMVVAPMIDEKNITDSVDVKLHTDYGADGPGSISGLMLHKVTDFDSYQEIALKSCGVDVVFEPAYTNQQGMIVLTGKADGEKVIQVKLDPEQDKAWIKLFKPIDHPDSHQTGEQDQLLLEFKYTVTDKDGDQVTNKLKIAIKDDGPEAQVKTAPMIHEKNLVDSVDVHLNTDYGKDGKGTLSGLMLNTVTDFETYEELALKSCGVDVVFEPAYTNQQGMIVLTGKADGEKVIEVKLDPAQDKAWIKLFKPIDHPDGHQTGDQDQLLLEFKYTVTDKDGDHVTNKLKIAIKDDGPQMKMVVAPMIDEKNITDSVDVKLHTDYGADGPGSISGLMLHKVTDFDSYQELALKSCGVDVVFEPAYTNQQGMIVLTGKADGEKVIEVKLDPAQDKAWIKLFKAIDHPDGHETGEQDQLLLEFKYTVTDKDGDQVTNKLKIAIKDDGPEAQVKTAPMIHEKNLVDSVDVHLNTDYGKDGKGTLSGLMLSKVTDYDSYQELALKSCGVDVVFEPAYENNAGELILVGKADGEVVIKVTVDPEQDKAWIKLFKPIDHPDNYQTGDQDQLLLEFKYTVTDKDGDQVTNKLKIAIKDDGPEMKVVVAPMIHEKNLVDSVDVKLHTDYGQDGAGSISGLMLNKVTDFDSYQELALKSCGVAVVFDAAYTNAQGMIILTGKADGEKVIEVKLDPEQDKAWIKLFKPLDHPDSHETGDKDQLLLEFKYTVTDKDGDQVTNKLKIAIKDDGPTAYNDQDMVVEGDKNGTMGNVLEGGPDPDENPANIGLQKADDAGADGFGHYKIVKIKSGLEVEGVRVEKTVADTDQQGNVEIEGREGGSLTINFITGKYTYIPPEHVDHSDGKVFEPFWYTIEDKDGDQDVADLWIEIKDQPVEVAVQIDDICIIEDSQFGEANEVPVSATSTVPLSKIVISMLDPDWEYDLTSLKTDPAITVTDDTDNGQIIILFNDADIKDYSATFGVKPPENSDVDMLNIKAKAFAGDKEATDDADIQLDPVADLPMHLQFELDDVESSSHVIKVCDDFNIKLSATFKDLDGSEKHFFLVEKEDGWTATNAEEIDGGPYGLEGTYFKIDANDTGMATISLNPPEELAEDTQYWVKVHGVAEEMNINGDDKDTSDNIAITDAKTIEVKVCGPELPSGGMVMVDDLMAYEDTQPGVSEQRHAGPLMLQLPITFMLNEPGLDEVTGVTISDIPDGVIIDSPNWTKAGNGDWTANQNGVSDLLNSGTVKITFPQHWDKDLSLNVTAEISNKDSGKSEIILAKESLDILIDAVAAKPWVDVAINDGVTEVAAGDEITVCIKAKFWDINDNGVAGTENNGAEQQHVFFQVPEDWGVDTEVTVLVSGQEIPATATLATNPPDHEGVWYKVDVTDLLDEHADGHDSLKIEIKADLTAPENLEPINKYTYEINDFSHEAYSDSAGEIHEISTTYNEQTDIFSFSVKIDDKADGFTLVVNDGPNPKGMSDQLAMIYFDTKTLDDGVPRVSIYSYNGKNNQSSFMGPLLLSSLTSNDIFDIKAVDNPDGTETYSLSVNTSVLNSLNISPQWEGIQFGEEIGVWLHPIKHLSPCYHGEDLSHWEGRQGWFDTEHRDTDTMHLANLDIKALAVAKDPASDADKPDDNNIAQESDSVHLEIVAAEWMNYGEHKVEGEWGNDVLNGLVGDDVFIGHEGDDTLYVGNGSDGEADTLLYFDVLTDGHDTIYGFDNNTNDNGLHDTVNLDHLFDKLEVAEGERADRVKLSLVDHDQDGKIDDVVLKITDDKGDAYEGFSLTFIDSSINSTSAFGVGDGSTNYHDIDVS